MVKNPRRSASEWFQIIEHYKRSGDTERQFCQRHGLIVATFRKWKYRYPDHQPVSASPLEAPDTEPQRFIELPIGDTPVERMLRLHWGTQLRIDYPLSLGIEPLVQLIGALGDGH